MTRSSTATSSPRTELAQGEKLNLVLTSSHLTSKQHQAVGGRPTKTGRYTMISCCPFFYACFPTCYFLSYAESMLINVQCVIDITFITSFYFSFSFPFLFLSRCRCRCPFCSLLCMTYL
ncbi:hypothetical protein BKA65DRAFT_166035 [Rhexocercosporidium sp. MPI-PUGE-AT-0058]|nr:hypothetical protein BKA65DRAFT_166035 [Rhexocercosporidium sp. MPI-PUGE-AT-0058]